MNNWMESIIESNMAGGLLILFIKIVWRESEAGFLKFGDCFWVFWFNRNVNFVKMLFQVLKLYFWVSSAFQTATLQHLDFCNDQLPSSFLVTMLSSSSLTTNLIYFV
jgi:hypothetical protein